jgi:hypothetical protein
MLSETDMHFLLYYSKYLIYPVKKKKMKVIFVSSDSKLQKRKLRDIFINMYS